MSLFNFSQEELLTFFAVLVRVSTLFAVLPVIGDRLVPTPIKVLLSLAVTFAIFPGLVRTGQVDPSMAFVWGKSVYGLSSTIALEAAYGLIVGFVAKIVFDIILFSGNLVGTFMGFSTAALYDAHQESQSQVVAEIQMAVAMLLFLVLDGHHLVLRASLDSYQIVGLGQAGFTQVLQAQLITLTAQVLKFGMQLAAPIAIVLFGVNIGFGVISKAMPQVNILVMSFAVTALIGLLVLFLGMPEFQSALTDLFGRVPEWILQVQRAMVAK